MHGCTASWTLLILFKQFREERRRRRRRMAPPHTQIFEDATAVTPLSSHEYATNLHPHWAIGAGILSLSLSLSLYSSTIKLTSIVPHGGYTLSILHRLATTHFKHTHPTRHSADPMPISMQMSFLRRTAVGPAFLSVEDAKLGARTSTIHVRLSQVDPQNDQQRIVKVVGYITVSDPVADVGVSSPSAWALYPPPPAGGPPGLEGDEVWKVTAPNRYSKFRTVEHQTVTFGPERRGRRAGVCDQWTRLHTVDLDSAHREGNMGKWTTEAAVFLSDWYPAALAELGEEALSAANKDGKQGMTPPFWYPTVTLSIDFKKRLPPGGVDWLYTRIAMKTVRNGRLDIEAIVLDEQGDIVLLGSQVALVVSAERNTSGREYRNGTASL
jgi:Thioesterase-like superfamily